MCQKEVILVSVTDDKFIMLLYNKTKVFHQNHQFSFMMGQIVSVLSYDYKNNNKCFQGSIFVRKKKFQVVIFSLL